MSAHPETAYRIEPPTVGDAATMLEVQHSGWLDEAATAGLSAKLAESYMPKVRLHDYREAVDERLVDPAAYLRIVRHHDSGLVVGLFDGDIANDMNWSVGLYLQPDVRRQGLGSLMLAGFEQHLDSLGNQAPISVKLLSANTPARRLYQKTGYSDVPGSATRTIHLEQVTMIKRREA